MDGTLALKKYNVVERLAALEEGGGYVLPVASAETLGGVKIGEGLSITEGGVLSADAGIVDYSTTEQKTGQKWIDGKDIYFKVITATQLSNNAANNLGEYATNVDTVIDVTGRITKTVGGNDYHLPLSYFDDANNKAKVYATNTNVYLVFSDGDFSAATFDVKVVIRYTKTEVTRKKK